jgi:aspartate racemase
MKTIGLVGGMSWQSSALYYALANERVAERLGGLHSARVVLASVDFAEVQRMQADGRWDDAADLLAQAAKGTEAAGADIVLICTNTMHKVADAVQASIGVPLLHLADVTAAAVRADGVTTVGLLGSAYVMEQSFYRERLERAGLTVVVPGDADRALVHRVIFDELCQGIVLDESRHAYRGVIDRLVVQGATGVILGCTEIELLIGAEDSPIPVFPTTRLHVEAAVDIALEGTA